MTAADEVWEWIDIKSKIALKILDMYRHRQIKLHEKRKQISRLF